MRRFLVSDLAEINGWYSARSLPELMSEYLPRVGYIEDGVAAGFLYATDAPGLVLLDGYITNPASLLRARYDAITSITDALLHAARSRGSRRVASFCKSRGIARLAEKYGLRPVGTYAMVAGGL